MDYLDCLQTSENDTTQAAYLSNDVIFKARVFELKTD